MTSCPFSISTQFCFMTVLSMQLQGVAYRLKTFCNRSNLSSFCYPLPLIIPVCYWGSKNGASIYYVTFSREMNIPFQSYLPILFPSSEAVCFQSTSWWWWWWCWFDNCDRRWCLIELVGRRQCYVSSASRSLAFSCRGLAPATWCSSSGDFLSDVDKLASSFQASC